VKGTLSRIGCCDCAWASRDAEATDPATIPSTIRRECPPFAEAVATIFSNDLPVGCLATGFI
jgi:hypothetical protein